MKKVNNFQITKVQPWSVALLLPDFLPIQSGVAYKNVAYKKMLVDSFVLSYDLSDVQVT